MAHRTESTGPNTEVVGGSAIIRPSVARPSWFQRNERRLFLAPAVILILALSIFPLIASLGMSFLYWNFSRPEEGFTFAGLAHWGKLFTDNHYHVVFRNTLAYVLIGVPFQYLVGLGLALLLNQQLKGTRFFRTLFLVPMMLSPVAVAYLLGRMTFNESQGPMNDLLLWIGLRPVSWLTSSPQAFFTIAMVESWQWIPFMMLLLLAGLQGLPVEVLEAAKLDAQSSWQVFRFIVFPLLLPWTVTALLLRSVEMLKIIDHVLVITAGGPGISTEPLTQLAYQTGVRQLDLGYASAISYSLLILTIIVATVFLLFARKAIARASD